MKISEKEILRYLGYHNIKADHAITQTIRKLLPTLMDYSTPKYVCGKWNIEINNSKVKLEGLTIDSIGLSKHIADCNQIILFGATLGSKIDRYIKKLSASGNMQKALIADTICNCMIEAYCDEIQVELMKDSPI